VLQDLPDHPTEESIVDYARGALSETEQTRIAAHLDSCSECRQSAHALGFVILGLEAEYGGHVPEQILVRLQSGESLGSGQEVVNAWTTERIQSHISYCDQCRAELELLNSIDANRIRDEAVARSQPLGSQRQWYTTALVPLAIAALLTIVIVTQWPNDRDRSTVTWETTARLIPVESLISLQMRSGTSDSTPGYPTSELACLAEFRKVLELTDSGVAPIVSPRSTMPANDGVILRAHLRIGPRAHSVEIVQKLPNDVYPREGDVTAWLLRMPARELRSALMPDDSIEVSLEMQSGEFIGFVWTYELGGQHFGLPAHIITNSD
jgi:hypothetical protein